MGKRTCPLSCPRMSPGDREEVASCLRRHHLVMLLGSSLILCLVATVAVVAVDIGIGLKIVSHQERRQQEAERLYQNLAGHVYTLSRIVDTDLQKFRDAHFLIKMRTDASRKAMYLARSRAKMNFFEASKVCQDLGAHLVEFHDMDQAVEVLGLFNTNNTVFWIGAIAPNTNGSTDSPLRLRLLTSQRSLGAEFARKFSLAPPGGRDSCATVKLLDGEGVGELHSCEAEVRFICQTNQRATIAELEEIFC